MKTELITTFIDELIIYDYILFGGVFVVFILLIVLGLVLKHKKALAIFLILLSFTLLVLGPTLGYIKMHQILYNNSTKLISQKQLAYTQAVVVYGSLKNSSKFDFKSCKITASAYKVSKNPLKNYLLEFKPFIKMSISEFDILKDEDREFKIIIEPFTYSKDYNISLGASCK